MTMDISDSEMRKMLEEQDYERGKKIIVDLSIKPQIPKKEDYSHLTMDEIVDNVVNKVASPDFFNYIEERCEQENISLDRLANLVQEEHNSKFKELCEQKPPHKQIVEEMRKQIFTNTQPQTSCDILLSDPTSATKQKDYFKTSKCEQKMLPKQNMTEQQKKKFDVNAEPKKLWHTLFHDHKSAIDRKDYFKAANTCRLIQNQIDFQVSKKELSVPAACLLKQSLLPRYVSIVDDVSKGGINNYFKEIQIQNNTSKPQCDKWVSTLDKLSEKELCAYMGKDFIISPEKESAYHSLLGPKVDENLLEDEVKKLVCGKLNATLENCPADILEKAFGGNVFPKKDSPKASTSKIAQLNSAPVPVFTASKRKVFIDETRNSYRNSNMSNSDSKSNEKEKIVVKRKQRDISHDLSESKIKDQPAQPTPSFKTANDMFSLQKNDKSSNNARKCLGARRGLSSKFVSPIFQQEDNDERSQKEEKTEVHDEQLKGIDPKMIEVMMSEIMYQGSPTSWDDIAGLKFVKATLQEIVVWPLLRPDLFTGLRGPPKGILLFGPPGTGKTLIGKCVASQSKSTFFSISASSLGSKWYGEGEKLVRALFTVARCHQPAVIFIDEIDSLLTQRSDNDHESSRRVKTEFLVQLDGVKTVGEERLLIIGATNRPQELDEAARRRLVKRLYIPLPEACARIQIVKTLLASHRHELTEDDLNVLKIKTDGYSGADMANLCKEAALGPIRSIGLENIAVIDSDDVRPIQMSDFLNALNQVRASVSDADLALYEDWNKKYGSIFSET